MCLAASQLPDKPCINSTENQVTGLSTGTGTLYIIQNPGNLGAGEISIKSKSGLLLEFLQKPLCLQVIHNPGGLTGLPYNRMIYRTPGILVPDYRSLTLVGDADSGNIACLQAALLQCTLHDLAHGAPDFLCIMLNPARLRKMLGKLLLSHADNLGIFIKNDCPVGSSTCIQCHYIFLSHSKSPSAK